MKDFDFIPETFSGALVGSVILPREIADLSVWRKQPFSAGHAIADLYLLANSDAGETKLGGLTIKYEAGWCLWSNKGLAERWGWRRESTEKFMVELEKSEIIRRADIGQGRKAIIIVSFGHANGTSWAGDGHANGTDGVGEGVLEKEGERPAVFKNFVPVQQAIDRFTTLESGYSAEEITSAWHELTAGSVDGCWVIGKPLRPVADWRSALESELWKRRQIFGEKKDARALESRRADEVPQPQKNSALTLEAMKGVVA